MQSVSHELKAGELLEVTIEKLSLGGKGIARHKGWVVFVDLSAPQDHLLVRISSIKKNFAEAEIEKILQPSPYRQKPECPVFGRCGGCNWQHLQYEEQLKQKQMIVQEQISHALGTAIEVPPVISSPRPFRYRNRIQLKYQRPKLGFFERKTHSVVDIQDCLIAEKPLVESMHDLRLKVDKETTDFIEKIELSLNTNEHVEINMMADSTLEGEGFSQINRFQNEILVGTVLQWLGNYDFHHLLDLYSGSGNFTFPIINKFPKAKCLGVELHPRSVELAHKKIQELNLSPKHAEFYLSDVESYLKRQIVPKNSVILLDPPRMGVSETALRGLAAQPWGRIFYISCNPASLARDLARLHKFSPQKWKVHRLQCFDMFPQTDLVETLVELSIDT